MKFVFLVVDELLRSFGHESRVCQESFRLLDDLKSLLYLLIDTLFLFILVDKLSERYENFRVVRDDCAHFRAEAASVLDKRDFTDTGKFLDICACRLDKFRIFCNDVRVYLL